MTGLTTDQPWKRTLFGSQQGPKEKAARLSPGSSTSLSSSDLNAPRWLSRSVWVACTYDGEQVNDGQHYGITFSPARMPATARHLVIGNPKYQSGLNNQLLMRTSQRCHVLSDSGRMRERECFGLYLQRKRFAIAHSATLTIRGR